MQVSIRHLINSTEMKSFIKHSLVVFVALALASCIGGRQNSPQTVSDSVQESEVDVAKTIWEKLTTEDPFFSEKCL